MNSFKIILQTNRFIKFLELKPRFDSEVHFIANVLTILWMTVEMITRRSVKGVFEPFQIQVSRIQKARVIQNVFRSLKTIAVNMC